ncbi:MAG: hypothetical protein P4L98_18425, partial [Ancalomicrobiaceae bacterium]|nr:hypothetical protein [Ancalomicrobiaceae bacterium]
LAVVDVTNRPDVAVRLVAIEFLFGHNRSVPDVDRYRRSRVGVSIGNFSGRIKPPSSGFDVWSAKLRQKP